MKLLYKIPMVFLMIAVLNLGYERYAFIRYADNAADQLLQVEKIKNCDVIYVSASSNFPPAGLGHDDPRKISQMLAQYFPELQFEAINKPASHAGTYLDLLSMFPEEAEANTFVITMNLRSFGPSWINSDLETALNKSAVFYNNRPPLLNRFLVSLNVYDDKSTAVRMQQVQEVWKTAPLPFDPPKNTVESWCAVEKWGDWRDPKRQLADQFIKQYGFVINTKNPRVNDFDQICQLAEERQWEVVFNLLAENMELADSLVGKDLTRLMRANADWLVERYTNKGYKVVDNLSSVAREHFADKDFPTEHYDATGREVIAKNVAAALDPL